MESPLLVEATGTIAQKSVNFPCASTCPMGIFMKEGLIGRPSHTCDVTKVAGFANESGRQDWSEEKVW